MLFHSHTIASNFTPIRKCDVFTNILLKISCNVVWMNMQWRLLLWPITIEHKYIDWQLSYMYIHVLRCTPQLRSSETHLSHKILFLTSVWCEILLLLDTIILNLVSIVEKVYRIFFFVYFSFNFLYMNISKKWCTVDCVKISL